MATTQLISTLASSVTESSSQYTDLEKMPISEILSSINREDATVPLAVQRSLPQIEALVEVASARVNAGGRLFYIGAGTSGRLGILDAAECPPTYGVPFGLVVGLMAGGDAAIRKAVEFAEDSFDQAWTDLSEFSCNAKDMVIGIAASGRTPYVVGGLRECQTRGIATGCIVCNTGSAVEQVSDYPVVVVVGAEFVTGSTRMKAGTAQKLVLNMISTACMIRMGRVQGNRMVDMQPTNIKLIARGVRMLMDELDLSEHEAQALFDQHGNVRKALAAYREAVPQS